MDHLESTELGIRFFWGDRKTLDTGSSWQYEIFESLDDCRRMLVVFLPSYLASKVCKEEFNIAWARNRNETENVLFAVYLYSANLYEALTV